MSTLETILTNSDEVHPLVVPRIKDIVDRALRSGAQPPLDYMGAGMYGAVLCDSRGRSYKVYDRLEDVVEEGEWLEVAQTVPGVQEYVPRLYGIYEDTFIVEKDCVVGRPGRWSDESKLFDLHQIIRKLMIPHGWTAPEFKGNSWIITESEHTVLVDHSMANRVGFGLVAYVQGVLDGERATPSSPPEFYAGLLQSDVNSGYISAEEVEDMIDLLETMKSW